MKRIITSITLLLIAAAASMSQELRPEAFDLLDLDYPGLEKVKVLHEQGDDAQAAQALLDYYRTRTGICTPEIRDAGNVTISAEQQKWADDALNHTFFVHKGYQPSFNYGKDIDWRYWPAKDNELRWQLHRHKWFTPMGYAYRTSSDEKYAAEWAFQYMDWIKKNPLVEIAKEEYELGDDSRLKEDAENVRFAWRPLEASHRLQDQTFQFQLFIISPHFTPEFLTEFLVNYARHARHILANYSEQGNHLLFEAQRMLYAGSFFPEFKDAKVWRQSGIDILNREIGVQVYSDGGQFELDPHYHLASIEIFCKSLLIADLNGFRNDFPKSYSDTVEKMIMFYTNIIFPDYTNPCFSDAKITDKNAMLKHYKTWSRLFPENETIKWFASEGKEGKLPDYLSKGFPDSGFFVLRNSWNADAVQMVVKAGPKAFWHCQPDNGTFELWFNGRNLFPDSGSYVYAGEGEVMEWRRWFRRSSVHNTLTLNDRNFETTDSETLLWKPDGDVQILVTRNQSYKGLSHRRSIFFVDGTYFVIVDEAAWQPDGDETRLTEGKEAGLHEGKEAGLHEGKEAGQAEGKEAGQAEGKEAGQAEVSPVVNLHFQMPAGNFSFSRKDMHFATEFEGDSNMKLQCFSESDMSLKIEDGWYSTDYMKKEQRMNISFNVNKISSEPVRYITVIVPKKESGDNPKISAKFMSGFDEKSLRIKVKVGKEKNRILEYIL